MILRSITIAAVLAAASIPAFSQETPPPASAAVPSADAPQPAPPAQAAIAPAMSAPATAPDTLGSIATYINEQARTDTRRIELVRQWVNAKSVHLMDDEYATYAWDTEQVLSRLWKNHVQEGPAPHLACGPRSFAMQAILDRLDLPNRMVAIFTDQGAALQSHTFLEVFNRDSGAWEIQDSDFNVEYHDHSGRKLSTAQMLFMNLKQVEPDSGSVKGWKANGVDHLRSYYFEAAVYFPRNENTGQYLVLVNTDRFDPKRVFPDNRLSFRDYVDQRYRNPPMLELGKGGAIYVP